MRKTAVITGATGGIGAELASALARRGYKLVLPCRSISKAQALRAAIQLHSPATEFDFLPCNLSDLASVAKCARAIAERHPVIDLVIANGATVQPARTFSAQGVEMTFAVNHLAHFTLVSWLARNLYVHSRVIFVASSSAFRGQPEFLEDICSCSGDYDMFQAYANSKLANIACAAAFSALLEPRQIACVSVHPGLIATGIWPEVTLAQKMAVPLLKKLYFAPPEKGAAVIAELALAPEYNESWGYYQQLKRTLPPGQMNRDFQEKLWHLSCRFCANYLPEDWVTEEGMFS